MNQTMVNHTIAHELIHAFDQCRIKVDWNNCMHHACSEVSLLRTHQARLQERCTFDKFPHTFVCFFPSGTVPTLALVVSCALLPARRGETGRLGDDAFRTL